MKKKRSFYNFKKVISQTTHYKLFQFKVYAFKLHLHLQQKIVQLSDILSVTLSGFYFCYANIIER